MATKRKTDEFSFKEGQPGDSDLDEFASKIGALKWEKLGLQLKISQNVLDTIKANEGDKPHAMLLHWINTTTSRRPYEELYRALCHERVGLNNPAKQFCCVEMGPASKAPKTVSKEKNKGVEMSPAAKSLKTCSNKGKTRTTESKQQMKKGTKRTRAKALEEEKKAEEPPEAVKEEKKAQVKTGQPSKDELEDIASKLEDDSWKKLARRLRIEDPKITAIDKAHDDLFEKAYQMLLHWTHKEGTAATYQVLFEALDNDKVNYRDLAQKYCCVKID